MTRIRRNAIANTEFARKTEKRTTPTRARRKIDALCASPPAIRTIPSAPRYAKAAKVPAATRTRTSRPLWNRATDCVNACGRTTVDAREFASR